MICSDCSTENPSAAKFCRQCGKKLATTSGTGGSIFKFGAAALLSALGVLFLLAGLVEGQLVAFVWAAPALAIAYWLFTRK